MPLAVKPEWTGEANIQRLQALYDLLVALSGAKALQDVYDISVDSLISATSADRAAILIFDEDGVVRFKSWRGLSTEYRNVVTGHSPWPKGTKNVQPIVVPDVRLEESLSAFQSLFAREGIRAVAFVPLALEEGVFGKFMLYYAEPHECSPEELAAAQAIGAHAALATEHKRFQLASRRSEERLQAILDNAPAVIFLKGSDGRYQLINRSYEELFHVTAEGIVGKTDHDIFPAEIANQLRENDLQVLATGMPLTVEEYAPQDDGIHAYLSVKFPLGGSPGAPASICGISTDVTERKKLEHTTRHLAAIVESSDDAIVSKDLNGIITSWNRGAERLFGYTAEEAIGQPVRMLAPSERLNEMPDILSKIRKGERVDHYETRRRAKDGEILDVSLTISPIRDASGRIIGASKIARDITFQKRAEAERASLLGREKEARQTAELLNQVGPRLASQLNTEKLAQEIIDISTVLVGAEAGSFDYSAGSDGESSIHHAISGDWSDLLAGYSEQQPGKGAIVRCDDIMAGLTNTAGPARWRSYLAAPVVSSGGDAIGCLSLWHSQPAKFTPNHEAALRGIASHAAIAMDNARLFQQADSAQRELRRSNDELSRANRDLETFAYSASHDLQEPLRTVALCAQLLDRTASHRLEGEDRELLDTILSASRRMTVLIEDLLAYTKATKLPAGPPPMVDTAAVLASTLKSLQSRIEESGAKVTWNILPHLAIHESRLAVVFQNLISNALKYCREVPCVHISATERDGAWVISVTDNGIGIDRQYAERIFGIFKRLHGHDTYEGSGVGLAICQRIVEQHGGRIWLDESEPGKGSTFCFSILPGGGQR